MSSFRFKHVEIKDENRFLQFGIANVKIRTVELYKYIHRAGTDCEKQYEPV